MSRALARSLGPDQAGAYSVARCAMRHVGKRLVPVTTHRRENFGGMAAVEANRCGRPASARGSAAIASLR
ncbi:hypothetical protein RZN05_10785 [Sphingomonas sp. HF-S4]|uniref:Uncharacterized protein n=1 Tax=Sphingomonas agrestis TaxID=3080540 RepID=A0ABU3Y7S4_9SPHN|nr:hypothetical protein [Sphingomonas sp. HF-S4]MDV3457470.1 hypothetical protein [Sphingomonas sp. HF-S4]